MPDTNFAGINSQSSVRQFPDSSFVKNILLPAVVILLIVLGGIGTGWLLSNTSNKKTSIVGNNVSSVEKAPGAKVSGNGTEVGLDDTKTFRDSAEGTLVEGGIEGEGTHHLERTGGASQNVYLTSSVVDLDQFVGKKVQVQGETMAGKKAGWLMDVGKIKITE